MTRLVRYLAVLVGGMVLGTVSFAVWASSDATVAADPTVVAAFDTTTTSSSTTTTAPQPAPTTTTTTLPGRGWLVIQGTGDVAVDPVYIPAFAKNGWDHAWSGLDGLFLEDDLTVINLECVPSDIGTPLDKKFVFRCPTEALPSIRANGIDVANMGNNHSGDYGKAALVDGRANLISAGIAPVGAGKDFDEAGEPAVFEINGWKIAVVGFGGIAPAESWYAAEDRPGMRSGDHTDQMVEAVSAAAEIADIVVVTVHWGVELDTQPRADDIARAEAMIDAGADVIFGHHPHRMQPLDFIDGSPVFWSLGNFVWPRLSIPSAVTAVARVVVSPDGVIEACLIPASIEANGHPVLIGEPSCEPGY